MSKLFRQIYRALIWRVVTIGLPLLIILFVTYSLFNFTALPLAQSESGVLFYNTYLFKGLDNIWSTFGFGTSSVLQVYLKTFIFNYLLGFGVDPFKVQFLFYFSLLSFGYFYFRKILNLITNNNSTFNIFASFIYIFNAFSMYILLRFQYPYIVFYYLSPFILFQIFMYIKSLRWKDSLGYLFKLNILLLVFSIFYGAVSNIILFQLFVFCIFFTASILDIKNLKLYMKKFLVFEFMWGVLNLFWLVPLVINFMYPNWDGAVLSSDQASDLSTLNAIANRLGGFKTIFTLKEDNFFLLLNQNLNGIYNNPLMEILSYIPFVGVVLFFLNFKFWKKYYNISIISRVVLLFALFLFALRATRFPFGWIFEFIFLHITAFQVFRNPFEKFNLVFVFLYLILAVLGYKLLLNQSKRKKILVYSILTLYIVGFNFPLLTGDLMRGDRQPFSNKATGFKIEIPSEYNKVRELVNPLNRNYENNDRLLVLPLAYEGQTYNWKYGYIGAEFIHYYLKDNAIAQSSGGYANMTIVKFLIDDLNKLKDPSGVLKLFGFNQILVRDDIDWKDRALNNPQDIKNIVKDGEFKQINFNKKYSISNDIKYLTLSDNFYSFRNFFDKTIQFPTIYNEEVNVGLIFDSLKDNFSEYYIVIELNNSNYTPTKASVLYNSTLNNEDKDNAENNKLYFTYYPKACGNCYLSDKLTRQNSTIAKIQVQFDLNKGSLISPYIDISNIYVVPNLPIYNKFTNQIFASKHLTLYQIENPSIAKVRLVDNYKIIKTSANLALLDKVEPNKTTYILEGDLWKKLSDNLSSSKYGGKIENLRYINNSKYMFKVNKDTNKDMLLVFSDSFDPLWAIYPAKSNYWWNPISLLHDKIAGDRHFKTDTFANGWIIKNSEIDKNFEYVLVYRPFIIFQWTVIINVFSVIGILSLYCYLHIRSLKQKK